jgi:hypothetical protein
MDSSTPARAPSPVQSFRDYFRCPESVFDFSLSGELSPHSGFFRFGPETICYGRCAGAAPAMAPGGVLPDVSSVVSGGASSVALPFDPAEVVENLRRERYLQSAAPAGHSFAGKRLLRQAYYALRPLLPVALRRHLQKIYLQGWESLPFPRWPLDSSVDSLHEALMALALRASGRERIPFIWFWPDGAPACAIMTHDVETARGRDFCGQLMDLNDSRGIKSSFQVVPEQRYEVPPAYLESIRGRGFELNVHDFNHDGHLYSDRQEFLRRAAKINHYAREFGAKGFRAGVMYRNLEWYGAFQFSYDMSVPNVAHLDPQRGGCCTVMPYFVDRILELPLTTTQDYPLFHILGDYSIDLWKRQIRLILEKHGLLSFIVHPDYVIEDRARAVYASLLDYLAGLRDHAHVWLALPRDVDSWWRQRSQMQLLEDSFGWRIGGPGSERARIAYASLQEDRVVYDLPSPKHTANSTGALP